MISTQTDGKQLKRANLNESERRSTVARYVSRHLLTLYMYYIPVPGKVSHGMVGRILFRELVLD